MQHIKDRKTVIVTGAGGSLGTSIVKKFLEEDYFVYGIYHSEKNIGRHENLRVFMANLADESETDSLINKIIEERKKIDVLICAAGGFAAGNVENTLSADLMKQYKMNFETAYNITRLVFLQMQKQQHGRIFLVGSRQGLKPGSGKGAVAYTLAKSQLFALAELLNASDENITTNMIVPSTIDTSANRNSMPDADFSNWVSPKKIAEVILFYCSETASVIKDSIIKVYGRS